MPITPEDWQDGVTVGDDGVSRPTPAAEDMAFVEQKLGDYIDGAADAAVGDISLTKADNSKLATSGLGYVNHGVTAGATRPTGWMGILWVGSVQPTNALDGDVWIDTT